LVVLNVESREILHIEGGADEADSDIEHAIHLGVGPKPNACSKYQNIQHRSDSLKLLVTATAAVNGCDHVLLRREQMDDKRWSQFCWK
jgi:hypothetical protein